MSDLERLVAHARQQLANNQPFQAVSFANAALNIESSHQSARDIIKTAEPTARTGMATLCYRKIDLHEYGMPNATILTPAHKGLSVNDLFAHHDTLFVVYHDAAKPRGYVKLTPDGFSTLHPLPARATFPVSDPGQEKPLFTTPEHPTFGTIIKFGKKAVTFAHRPTRTLTNADETRTHKPAGRYDHILLIDNEAAYRLEMPSTTERKWSLTTTDQNHPPFRFNNIIDFHPDTRYLRSNTSLTPYDLTIMYSDTGDRLVRIAHEIPLTICDNIRAEEKRQIDRQRR